MKEEVVLLTIGIIFLAIPLLIGGPNFIGHTAEHVASDLTIELLVHVFLLGIALIIYGACRLKMSY